MAILRVFIRLSKIRQVRFPAITLVGIQGIRKYGWYTARVPFLCFLTLKWYQSPRKVYESSIISNIPLLKILLGVVDYFIIFRSLFVAFRKKKLLKKKHFMDFRTHHPVEPFPFDNIMAGATCYKIDWSIADSDTHWKAIQCLPVIVDFSFASTSCGTEVI